MQLAQLCGKLPYVKTRRMFCSLYTSISHWCLFSKPDWIAGIMFKSCTNNFPLSMVIPCHERTNRYQFLPMRANLISWEVILTLGSCQVSQFCLHQSLQSALWTRDEVSTGGIQKHMLLCTVRHTYQETSGRWGRLRRRFWGWLW